MEGRDGEMMEEWTVERGNGVRNVINGDKWWQGGELMRTEGAGLAKKVKRVIKW